MQVTSSYQMILTTPPVQTKTLRAFKGPLACSLHHTSTLSPLVRMKASRALASTLSPPNIAQGKPAPPSFS